MKTSLLKEKKSGKNAASSARKKQLEDDKKMEEKVERQVSNSMNNYLHPITNPIAPDPAQEDKKPLAINSCLFCSGLTGNWHSITIN